MKKLKPKKVLIDGDLHCYDIPYAAESGLEEGVSPSLDYCMLAFESRLERILEATGCTEYVIYLTGKGNFRENLATIKPYKGNRSGKPKLYKLMREWLQFKFQAEVIHGMEADDKLAIEQKGDTVICSRDKDLRMVEGWHYGYQCGKQPEFKLKWIDKLGYLERNDKGKVKGGGLMFFYLQMLTGDTTDNIQGVPKVGDVKAYNILKDCTTEQEMFSLVYQEYVKGYGEDNAREAMLENGNLLWMVTELDSDGNPLYWSLLDNTNELMNREVTGDVEHIS
jgi:5'-3' exonuclease